jgi:hypothetical protein
MDMPEPLPIRQVEVSFVGDGRVLRRLVPGSFQPFLDALRGHEVVGLGSTPPAEEAPAAG